MPGLLATLTVVVVWEAYAKASGKEYISTATKRLQTKRRHQVIVGVLGLAVTAHLIKKGV